MADNAGWLTDRHKRFLLGLLAGPLAQMAVCMPIYAGRLLLAVRLYKFGPGGSMAVLAPLLLGFSRLALAVYGVAILLGLPTLWGLHRLRLLTAPIVTAIGVASGILIFGLCVATRGGLGPSAYAAAILAVGPFIFSIVAGLPWSARQKDRDPHPESVFD